MTVKPQEEAKDIDYVLNRSVSLVEKREILRQKLLEGHAGQPLRIKLGIDPTHYDLTIGHAVVLRKLRQFQRLGHKAVIVIGDWTARLGDPSGRVEARKALTEEEVNSNAKTYLDQVFKIVDRNQTEIRLQSEWFDAFTLKDVIKLQGYKTVAQMLARDDFAKRYKSGIEIYLSEFMYPLLQGYDSVALRADVELGGTDQTFNLLVGRELQPLFGQPSQQILTVNLIVGLDGVKKMGKSLDNYIAMTAQPTEMFGKLMSLPDHAMRIYFESLTDVETEELDEFEQKMTAGTLNPRDVKLRMAHEIVTEFHSPTAAEEAQEAFIHQFSERKLPETIPEFYLTTPKNIVEFMVETHLAASNSKARELIRQNGVSIFLHGENGEAERVTDANFAVDVIDGAIVKVGKRQYIRIKG